MGDIVFNAPIDTKLHVYIINDETEQYGHVELGFGRCEWPTKEKVKARIKEFEDNELERDAPGFRLMTKREVWNHLCEQDIGYRFAMPGGEDWTE